MKINLITQKDHKLLKKIYENYPILTLQNKGYEELNTNEFSSVEEIKHKKVTTILKTAISGFRRFQNFKIDKEKNIFLRFQYNYNYDNSSPSFTGVGYVLLDELINEFTTTEE
jgi:hypothetical protein